MNTISKNKLKIHMLKIFRDIEKNNEELIVTDRNRPVLKIIPFKQKYPVEKLFSDIHGKVIYKEDINSTTKDEWSIT